MTAIPNPEGINEADYESIEAAVTETVRGRWFLNEFARRTRAADTQTMLQAMARLENIVTAAQPRLEGPSSDPSIRMLVQRIKEIAGHLDDTARAMREGGANETFCQAVAGQARAVAGLMRAGSAPGTSPPAPAALSKPEPAGPAVGSAPRLALPVAAPSDFRVGAETRAAQTAPQQPQDPRLPFLSGLDRLTLAQKTALFT